MSAWKDITSAPTDGRTITVREACGSWGKATAVPGREQKTPVFRWVWAETGGICNPVSWLDETIAEGPPLVIVESPYGASDPETLARNIAYARAAVRDCLLRGEAPIASHLLYTQDGILDDNDPKERQHGIDAGLAWGRVACKTVLYTDLGMSRGMTYGKAAAEKEGRPCEERSLPEWAAKMAAE